MDNLQAVLKSIKNHVLISVLIENIVLLGMGYAAISVLHVPVLYVFIGLLVLGFALSFLIMRSISEFVIEPLRALWQVIVHLSPEHSQAVTPPNLEQLRLGRELVSNLMGQIYQLATVADRTQTTINLAAHDLHHNVIANNLPLPLFVLDAQQTIIFANHAASTYVGIPSTEMIGKNVYMVLDMSFPSDDTFDIWLKTTKSSSATATKSWDRVRLSLRDRHPTRLFDLAAYYNQGNVNQIETMLVMFDHTKQYSQDDQAISFMALSVHELRTPLTLLRGYIEVFEEELATSANPELQDFMHKMSASAQQLTAFVNNILNVARIDDDQLELRLQEGDWTTILKTAVDAVSLRAQVRGIIINCTVAPDLPPVGVDRLSIQEVINNLIDNAIKYSGTSKQIIVDAHLTQDDLVETTIQDFGLGIATSIIPNLFTKFYRDHRNRAQIGGTGLGLYLSQAIVTAHGGHVWVRSTENEGSTFGFTLLPYSKLADEIKNNDNKEIVRGAHGWIKNHSMYRR